MDSKRTLFIRGIADDVDRNVLFSAFSPFGTILNLEIPRDREKDKNKNIAFIEFEEEEDAKHAMFNRHNSELYGKIIKIAYSTHANVHQTTSKRSKAVWDTDLTFDARVTQDVIIDD